MGILTALVPAPYRWIAFALAAITLWGHGWVKGANHGEAKLDAYKVVAEKATLVQAQKSAQTTANLRDDAIVLEEVKNAENKAIAGRLAAALADGVRNRAERRAADSAAPAACQGATGAELSKPDAGFLAGEAARADRLRAALATCYASYDKARDALATLAKP